MYYLYFDGGSKGNPGKAGCGSVLYDNEMNEIDTVSSYCGDDKTNNYAEYSGLIVGIEMALRHSIQLKDVVVRGDSLLIVKQCKGEFKVKHPNLLPLYSKLQQLVGKQLVSSAFNRVEHVYRTDNKRADQLANIAMSSN